MAIFRALVLHEEGGKVVPRVDSVDEDRLPRGEVTVAVECSTLNYKDGMILQGIGRLVRNYPHVPGVDFAGTVERSDSPEFKPGDKVVLTGWRVGEAQWGGYAQKARVKASMLVKLPDGMETKRATGREIRLPREHCVHCNLERNTRRCPQCRSRFVSGR